MTTPAGSAVLRRLAAWSVPALLAALLPLAAGCGAGGGNAELARVGSHVITVDDFLDAARSNPTQYPGSSDSAKTLLLNDLVKRALLLEDASASKLVPDSAVQSLRARVADRIVVEALVRKLVPTPDISESELKQIYAQRGQEAHIHIIFTPERAQADSAAAAIKAGAPFEQVATRYNNPALLPATGDLGFVSPGAMVEPLDGIVQKAKVGELQGPVPAPGQGFFVARIEERRARKQDPYDTQKGMLRQMLTQRKSAELQQKAYTSILQQYEVDVPTGGPQALYAKLNSLNQAMSQGMHANMDLFNPAPGDEKITLGTYKDEHGKSAIYSLADAMKDLRDPMTSRPSGSDLTLVKQWIQTVIVQRALKIEAARRHVADEPAVARRIRQNVDNALLQGVYQKLVAERVPPPGDAELHAVYEKHAAQIQDVAAAKLLVVTLKDTAGMGYLMAHGLQPGSLRAAAAKVPGASVAEKSIEFPSPDPQWENMRADLRSMNPNDVRGPLRTPSRTMFVQLLSKQQGQVPFEKLSPEFRQGIMSEAVETGRDRALTALTDSLHAALKVEIRQDRLKRIPWPVPPAPGGLAPAPGAPPS